MIRRAILVAVVLSLAVTSLFAAALEGSLRLSWGAAAVVLSRHRAVEHPTINGPQARPDSYSVLRGQTLTVSAANGVLANDTDSAGKTLSASVVTSPAHGTLTLASNGGFTYLNDGSSATSDSFTYKASDGTSTSAPATVTITITGNPPAANADAYNATQGQTLSTPAPGVLANDTLNGAVISSYGATLGTEQATVGSNTATAQNGTVNLKSDGSFVYNSAGNFTGTDSFKYVVTNGAGASTATVTITVLPPAPVASNDSVTTSAGATLVVPAPGVFANDTLNGATLASYGATGVEQMSIGSATATAQGGNVVLNANGGFTFTPAGSFTGSDTFQYVLGNPGGNSSATVTIAVQPKTGPDFSVTSPGFFYAFAGMSGQNPQLTLTRGRTYTFQINTDSIHPFEILDAPAGSVSNNNISSGTITFRVPTTAANYRYICSVHGFGNDIVTTP